MNEQNDVSEQNSISNTTAPISVRRSILNRACDGDKQSIATMFAEFIPEGEQYYSLDYLGIRGFFGFGVKSFGCMTSRRIATIQIGRGSEMIYQDAYLEGINSLVVYQPSILPLYIAIVILVILAVPTFGLSLPLIPIVLIGYYRARKCGLVCVIREGLSVYMFTNRKRLQLATALLRAIPEVRERRLKELALAGITSSA